MKQLHISMNEYHFPDGAFPILTPLWLMLNNFGNFSPKEPIIV